jgi:hypothetical protein
MRVAIGREGTVAAMGVWYDSLTGLLSVDIAGVVYSIDFAQIPDDDFESKAPVIAFATGCEGAVVVCRHRDGKETWLPVDMWLPGGFDPS